MQKVGVLAVTVSILLDLTQVLALMFVLELPRLVVVKRSSLLQASKNVFVLVCHSCDLLDSHRAIERGVRVESIRVRLWHLSSGRYNILRLVEVDLKHLA